MAALTHRELLLRTLERQRDEVLDFARTFPANAAEVELKPGHWPVRQHFHHLRATEERYLDRLEGVLREGQYVPPPVQPSEPPAGEPLASIVEQYGTLRARELEVLRGLDDAAWAQTFTHPTIWGDVAIEWWAERMVQHTAEHLDELWMLRQLAGLTPDALERAQRVLFST